MSSKRIFFSLASAKISANSFDIAAGAKGPRRAAVHDDAPQIGLRLQCVDRLVERTQQSARDEIERTVREPDLRDMAVYPQGDFARGISV